MSLRPAFPLVATLLVLIICVRVFATELSYQDSPGGIDKTLSLVDTLTRGYVPFGILDASRISAHWPVCAGVLQTSTIATSFTSFGTFGLQDPDICPGECDSLSWPCVSFETPAGSGIEYLYVGALWVGGVVQGDTLVSVGADGWRRAFEFYPPEDPRVGKKSIRPTEAVGGEALRAVFADTVLQGVPDDYFGRRHVPLGISVTVRGFASDRLADSDAVIYDVVVTNIANATIHDGYVGILVDGDVYHTSYVGPVNGFADDIAGYIDEEGIAYIIDADGDPTQGQFTDISPTRAVGAKIHATSFPVSHQAFNWWVSDGDMSQDYGPMRRDEYRDFATGGRGTPEGDVNKYYQLSKASSDFDQALLSTVTPSDSEWIWAGSPSLAIRLSCGGDIKFLLSAGAFTLAPGEHVRLLFSLFTADSVHVNPANAASNLTESNYHPELYVENLQLHKLVQSGRLADLAAARLLHPKNPPTGLVVASKEADSAVISWDPWVFPSILGYRLLLESVEPSATFPYAGTIPPWYVPEPVREYAIPAKENSFVIRGLEQGVGYSVRLSHHTEIGKGALSNRVYMADVYRATAPVVSVAPFVNAGDAARIAWEVDGSAPVDHFNIYRISDSALIGWPYHSFYDTGDARVWLTPTDSFLIDSKTYYYYSMTPIGQVDGYARFFDDTSPLPIGTYVIASVDSSGFESSYSAPASIVVRPQPIKDVLVLSSWEAISSVSIWDSIVAFYDRTLDGLDYDIFNLWDSISYGGCSTSTIDGCVNLLDILHYRLIILDDKESPSYAYLPFPAILDYLSRAGRKVAVSSSMHGFLFGVWNGLSPGWRVVDNPWLRDFGIDSIYYMGFRYCPPTEYPCSDTLLGFDGAVPMIDGVPRLDVDTGHSPWAAGLANYWDITTPPFVEAYRLIPRPDTAQVASYRPLYTFDSRYESSPANGAPVGIRWIDPYGSLRYAFGFHLYTMKFDQSRQLIDWILADDVGDNLGVPKSSNMAELPSRFTLGLNYPNPFNPSTTIQFALPEACEVRLDVFNILGQLVRRLVDTDMTAGFHSVVWDGRADDGRAVASGVYFYRLSAGEMSLSRKMLLLK